VPNLTAHITTQQHTKPKLYRFLIRSWCGKTRVNLRTQYAQYSTLRFLESKSGVMSRLKPLQNQCNEREGEAIHTISFLRAKPARRPENTWYTTTATIKNPQDHATERGWLRNTSFPSRCMASIARLCTLNCTLEFEKHVPNVQHVLHELVELNSCYCCNF